MLNRNIGNDWKNWLKYVCSVKFSTHSTFNKDNIKISLDNGYLTIEAKVEEAKEDKKHYILKERYSTSMSRSYYVGENLKEEDISAKFENGILNLEIQKKEPVKEEKKFIQIA